jgi:antitoxin component YwqK of YwqJK toxin-antitoxin module
MKTIIILSAILVSFSGFAQEMVSDKDIESRDGIRYIKGEDKPYSGKLACYFENGNIEAEAVLIDGKFNGPEYYYYENGNKRSLMNYRNDNPEGEVKIWNEDGSLSFDGLYKEGLLYKNKKPFGGTIKSYFNDGQIQEERQYKEGMRHGTEKRWTKDGKLISEFQYNADKLVYKQIYIKKDDSDVILDDCSK